MLVSSFRSCSAHFSLSSSSSMLSSLVTNVSAKFLFKCAFQSADFCRDVGFGDSQNLADFRVVVSIEVEKNEPLVQRVKSVDGVVQKPDLVRLAFFFVNDVQQRFFRGKHMPGSDAFAAIERNRNVERDAIHPGREPGASVVGVK